MSKSTFKFSKRGASFGKLNPRTEFNGEDQEKATDVKVTFRATKRDLEILMPQQDGTKASEVFYTEDGHLRMPYLVPLPINRQPEGLLVTIHDQRTASGKPLIFADATAKKLSIEMKPKFEMIVTMMLQLKVDAESQAARLYNIMDNEREFELVAQQDEMDLFLTPDEKKAAKQADAFDEDIHDYEEDQDDLNDGPDGDD